MEESDYIFFAGDGIFGVTRTLENVADKLYAVGGNCDNSLYPEELVVDVEKVRFLIVHGHRFHDKLDLVYRAKEVGADCVCFGHTHSYSDETYDGVRLINFYKVQARRTRLDFYAVLSALLEHFGFFHDDIDRKSTRLNSSH